MNEKTFEKVINHLNAERLSLLIALAQAQVEVERLKQEMEELKAAASREWE